jgi:hypothetical protein
MVWGEDDPLRRNALIDVRPKTLDSARRDDADQALALERVQAVRQDRVEVLPLIELHRRPVDAAGHPHPCVLRHLVHVVQVHRASAEIIDWFVWQPAAEIDTEYIFAFGRRWTDLAQELDLPLLGQLGNGGTHCGSKVPSRAVRVFRLPSDQRLVVEWHAGSAGPPRRDEVGLLRDALHQVGAEGRWA